MKETPFDRRFLEKYPQGVCIGFFDEMRLGLQGQVRRVWAPKGEDVEQAQQFVFAWSYLILQVQPLAKKIKWAWVPSMKAVPMAEVIARWKQEGTDLLIGDHAKSHKSATVKATGIKMAHIPKYSPQLDPAERVFEEIRREIEGEVYGTLAQKQAAVDRWLTQLASEPERIASLACWPWIEAQLKSFSPNQP